MQVLMLRNVSEERNLSMKLYADRLTYSLRNRCALENFYPWNPPYFNRAGLGMIDKGMNYAARFGVYPSSLLRRRADVFHILDHGNAHLLSCLPSRRTVVTCHDLMLIKLAQGEFGKDAATPILATKIFQLSLRLLSKAAFVLADSQATADDLVRYTRVSRQQIRVIALGIDPHIGPPLEGTRGEARARFNFNGRPILLHVGNNWFYKNLEGLIRALAVLKAESKRNPPLLVKVGKGLTSAQSALAASLNVSDCIREAGVLDGEDLQRMYWASDVLVFPSLCEGFGWPPLEAMASGTPVVCSNRGSLGEVVGDAATVINPEKPESIAEGISNVLKDEHLRNALIVKGLQRARQFTWERAAEETFRVYQEVAN